MRRNKTYFKIILNSCQFAIDFDKLIENPTLKHLEMKEISLKENFYVECYNGMMDIWYDDVSLNENLDFLTKYPALEVLRLDSNPVRPETNEISSKLQL